LIKKSVKNVQFNFNFFISKNNYVFLLPFHDCNAVECMQMKTRTQAINGGRIDRQIARNVTEIFFGQDTDIKTSQTRG